MLDVCRRARAASRSLAAAPRGARTPRCTPIADALVAATDRIVAANDEDIARGRADGMAAGAARPAAAGRRPGRRRRRRGARRRRPARPGRRGGARAARCRTACGCGRSGCRWAWSRWSTRPGRTSRWTPPALALKSGNAVVLRGGSAAAVVERRAGRGDARGPGGARACPADLVATVDAWGRDGVRHLMRARGLVDVLIPRGGAGLIQAVVRGLDRAGDRDRRRQLPRLPRRGRPTPRRRVADRAELQDPAGQRLQRGRDAARARSGAEPSPARHVLADLHEAGVRLHADERASRRRPPARRAGGRRPPTRTGRTEYLALEVAVGVVDDLDAALEHIRTWSSGHTEAIVTADLACGRTVHAPRSTPPP